MVATKVAVLTIVLGCAGIIIGVIAGVAFSTSGEFVTATLTCNPDAAGSLATDSNCEANTVLGSDGNVCQVGNLGLFTASFTPQCTYDTAYALSTLVAPQDNVDPTEFGLLFPAQTNIAGIGDNLGFPAEFTSCSEYFEDASIQTGLAGAAVGQTNQSLDALRENIKTQYDAGIDGFISSVDLNFAGAFVGIHDAIYVANGFNTSDINLTDSDAAAFSALPGTWQASMNFIGQNALRALVVDISGFNDGNCVGTLDCLQRSAAFGTPDWNAAGVVGGLSSFGFYASFDSPLCLTAIGFPVNGVCTYLEFLQVSALNPGLDAETATLLNLLLTVLTGYELEALAQPAVIGALGGVGLPLNRTGIETAIQAAQTSSGPLAFQQVGAVLSETIFGKDAVAQNLKDGLSQENAIPQILNVAGVAQTQSFGLVCSGASLLQNCTIVELIAALLADPEITPEEEAGLQAVQTLFGGCLSIPQPNLDLCLPNLIGVEQVSLGGATALEATTFGLLENFYDIAVGQSVETYLANATAQCEDDVLDIQAIQQAQTLVPPGIGLGGAGVVLAILGMLLLAMGSNPTIAKLLFLVAGIASIVGVALILVALLGVYNAPIFESVGAGDGDIEDGGRLFSTGIALTYAFATIGGIAAGAVIVFIGGLCLPRSAEVDALSAKA